MPGYGTSLKRFLLVYFLPFLALAGTCFLNSVLFRKVFAVGWKGYFDWYIRTGPFIELAVVVFGVAWESLDKNTGLVSANPLAYIGSCLQLVGLPLDALGGHLQTKNYNRVNPWDLIVATPLIAFFTLATIAWFIFVAPPQYFLFLVCGAPSRVALNSDYRLQAEFDGNILKPLDLKPDETKPVKGWDASMRNKPVTMANAFGAAVLFIIGYFLRP
ncbi:MAG TPA: hypothetical protein VJS64_20245 [Pyrinomonadaceae bacterium]|nr:hypothetical protein [Pyrinomonadaceae bacterium]